jgi:lysozyme
MFDRPKLEHAPVSDPVAPRRKVSREGLALIKSLEGFQPRAWRRPDGRWALGFGHTRSAREGLTVSEADAELLLQYDLLPVVAALNDRVSRPLNQHQFDALASFALSVGVDAFVTSEVLTALNAEGPEGAARALAASTDVDPALARAGRRRHAEWALFGADPGTPVTVAALLSAPAPETPPVETTPSAEAPADEVATAPDTQTPEALATAADAATETPAAEPERDDPPALQPPPAPDAGEPPVAPASPVQATESADAVAAAPSETRDEEATVAPEAPVVATAPVADATPAAAPPAPTPPAFSLRYAAAVSHLLGEAPGRAAPRPAEPVTPTSPAEPAPAAIAAPASASELPVEPAAAADAPALKAEAPTTPPVTPPEAAEAPASEPAPAADVQPSPPAAAEVDRQAVLAELMRRQMSPFAIQVGGPLPQLSRPAAPVAPPPQAAPAAPVARTLRPPVAASGPMTAVLAGPLLLPEPSSEADPIAATAPLIASEALPGGTLAVEPVPDAEPTPPLIEMEAAPVAPLVLTPPPSVEPDIQRPVWSSEERNPPARSLETDLFSEDELAADIGLGPVLRHEIVETPGRRFDFGQLGAYAGMGAVGLVSLGAAVPAAQALFDEGAGPSGETLLVFAALALIGAGCSGISGFNLWRLWREAHARDQAPRDA